MLTACLHVDRTVAKVKCHRRELLAPPCFAWNISAIVFWELPKHACRAHHREYKLDQQKHHGHRAGAQKVRFWG